MNVTDNISDLRSKPHLSYSAINSYLKCSLRYRFSYMDHIEKEQTSDALIFGSVIHRAIASLYQNQLEGIYLTVQELQEIFKEDLKTSIEEEPIVKFKKGTNVNSLINLGDSLLKDYYQQVFAKQRDLNIIGIEEPFSVYLENINLPLIGFIDQIFSDGENIIICEIKTSSKSYNNLQIDDNDQLALYQRAVRSMGYENRNIILRIDCLIKTKDPQVKSYFSVCDKFRIQKLVKKIYHVWDGINKGIFIPNPGYYCGNCCYSKACKEWFSK